MADPGWAGLRWPGATVVILASGQSLTSKDCGQVHAWRLDGENKHVIAINTTFRLAPWADVLYGCDAPWWLVGDAESARKGFSSFHQEAMAMSSGQLWTQDARAHRDLGIRLIVSQMLPGLGKRPGVIHQGGNGGYQAINLAYQAGAAKIILLGFDMHGTHWHGKYANGLPNASRQLFSTWIANFDQLAVDLAKEGVVVKNCTRDTRLTCFEKADLSAQLE